MMKANWQTILNKDLEKMKTLKPLEAFQELEQLSGQIDLEGNL